MAVMTAQKNPMKLEMQKFRGEHNMLYGAVGYIGGQEVTVTHRNPETGEIWCECDEWDEGGKWVDFEKVSFSKNPVI